MKILLLTICALAWAIAAHSQRYGPAASHPQTDEYTDWIKLYNHYEDIIDSTRYELARFKFCVHTNKLTHAPTDPVMLEIKFGAGQETDSTVLYGNIVITGSKSTFKNGREAAVVPDTTRSFFSVSNGGETFADMTALPYAEVGEVYVVLDNVDTFEIFKTGPQWKRGQEHLHDIIREYDRQEKIHPHPKPNHRPPTMGVRG